MTRLPHIEAAVARAAAFVRDTWQQVVMGAITVPGAKTPNVNIGLRQIYADNIVVGNQVVTSGNVVQRIQAAVQIAKDLENGRGPFDMKPALLAGPKSRINKKGQRYNIIPFRHGASSLSLPNSNFRPMPQDIYQQARELKASARRGNGMQWGGKLTGTENRHPAGQNPTLGYQHKAGRYEGMVRIEKQYARTTQGKYMTFRVVSENSDPLSWHHPGYEPHHIAEGVAKFCQPAVERMILAGAEADMIKLLKSNKFLTVV